ncbi:ATP-dependent protease La (LON) domain protein isoform X2 [Tasmannia lanceolata]|uniref:ATP-dependent protease La (LON) domain protein isoform X2 n=1 Tax=Tasmannia lanceolata TaxID=3420 RepID=UPI00406325C5
MSYTALALLSLPLPNPNPIPNSSLSPFLGSKLLKKISVSTNSRPRFYAKASFTDLPLLPFQADEVLVPSESKRLHLYEARFLALLEEVAYQTLGFQHFTKRFFKSTRASSKSLVRKKKFFVHFVLEPVHNVESSAQASFAARYGCLVLIENVERLEIGALVSIRGIGRVNIVQFIQMEPYLRGIVIPIRDQIPECLSKINSRVMKLKEDLYNLHSLQIKLRDSKDELLQTPLTSSLRWAEKELLIDCYKSFIPTLVERISFSALQPITGSTRSELLALQREKLRAMDLDDTSERLANSIELVKNNIAMVAAKLAIQSLEA